MDGSSSTWRNGDPLGATTGVNLLVGNSGGGTLSITNGGSVSVTGATYLAACVGATGVVNLGDSGGTLTTQSLFASPNQLLGTGTVNTRGLVADSNLLFGAGHAPTQTVTLRGAGQNVTINLDMTLGFGNSTNGFLGAGWKGSGSLTIQDGIEVDSASGYLGYGSGSTGTAVVSGSASKWRTVHDIVSNGDLYVGYYGTGSLSIINGGYAANDGTANIGDYPGSVGAVTVNGSGSTWCPASLSVGNRGSGRLSITRGGSVWDAGSLALGTGSAVVSISGGGTLSATSVAIGRSSLLSIDVGRGSFLMVSGTAPPTNSGTIRIVAGAGVPANVVFAPIYLNKYVPCQTVGGTCNYYNYFTASSVTSGTSGSPISLNLASSQRALVRDNGTGWTVGASFPAASSTANMTFTATAMDDTTLGNLRSQLPAGQSVLSGWTFSTTDFTVSPTNPAYLSFQVGAGQPSDLFEVWHYDGSAWTEYPATDLTYDGNYASFTATSFSGYAMVVPEPGTLALLAAGLLGILAYVRRKRK